MGLLLTLVLAGACHARGFQALVHHVTDGDTVWVQGRHGPAQQVRLQGIDAPEICQPYGREAQAALAARLLHQRVTVQPGGQDDYQRTLARVRVGREDVGAWMVAGGHAWAHRFRGKARLYAQLEAQARRSRAGLWSDPAAMEPREFRRRHGSCHR